MMDETTISRDDASLRPAQDFQYYGDVLYWNNFPEVQAYLNRLLTGFPDHFWREMFGEYPQSQKLLSLNCGNGWVERDLFGMGFARSVIGTDLSEPLLNEAREAARDIDMPAEYVVMDANSGSLATLGFDSVLNHAALHHVAYIDRLMREICVHLPAEGLFINYDYIGPHRNQYSWRTWLRVMRIWQEIPPHLRTSLGYPHLPSMLAADPTEAIHSELIVPMLKRYFDFVVQRPLGGAIAYPLLWENRGLYEARETAEGAYWLNRILEEDTEYTAGKLENSLFGFFICRPRKSALADERQLAQWTREETEREDAARRNGGRYYPKTVIERIYDLPLPSLRRLAFAALARLARDRSSKY